MHAAKQSFRSVLVKQDGQRLLFCPWPTQGSIHSSFNFTRTSAIAMADDSNTPGSIENRPQPDPDHDWSEGIPECGRSCMEYYLADQDCDDATEPSCFCAQEAIITIYESAKDLNCLYKDCPLQVRPGEGPSPTPFPGSPSLRAKQGRMLTGRLLNRNRCSRFGLRMQHMERETPHDIDEIHPNNKNSQPSLHDPRNPHDSHRAANTHSVEPRGD